MQQIFAEYMDKGNYSLLNCHKRYEVVGVCIWPLMSGSFQLKKNAREKHMWVWDAFTWSFKQPGNQLQKTVTLMG